MFPGSFSLTLPPHARPLSVARAFLGSHGQHVGPACLRPHSSGSGMGHRQTLAPLPPAARPSASSPGRALWAQQGAPSADTPGPAWCAGQQVPPGGADRSLQVSVWACRGHGTDISTEPPGVCPLLHTNVCAHASYMQIHTCTLHVCALVHSCLLTSSQDLFVLKELQGRTERSPTRCSVPSKGWTSQKPGSLSGSPTRPGPDMLASVGCPQGAGWPSSRTETGL